MYVRKTKDIGTFRNVSEFIRALPSFCYQEMREIITSIEVLNEDVNPYTVKVQLCRLARLGQIERVKSAAGYNNGKRIFVYKYRGLGKSVRWGTHGQK